MDPANNLNNKNKTIPHFPFYCNQKENDTTSHKRVLKALTKLGISDKDAKVYLYLAKEGPQKTNSIATQLKICPKQLCHNLRNLQEKGIICSSSKDPSHFTALPFNEALDVLIKANLNETYNIEDNKAEIFAQWRTMINNETAV